MTEQDQICANKLLIGLFKTLVRLNMLNKKGEISIPMMCIYRHGLAPIIALDKQFWVNPFMDRVTFQDEN